MGAVDADAVAGQATSRIIRSVVSSRCLCPICILPFNILHHSRTRRRSLHFPVLVGRNVSTHQFESSMTIATLSLAMHKSNGSTIRLTNCSTNGSTIHYMRGDKWPDRTLPYTFKYKSGQQNLTAKQPFQHRTQHVVSFPSCLLQVRQCWPLRRGLLFL